MCSAELVLRIAKMLCSCTCYFVNIRSFDLNGLLLLNMYDNLWTLRMSYVNFVGHETVLRFDLCECESI